MKQNSSQNKSERVVVNVRIRPFTDDEKRKDSSSPFESVDPKRNILSIKKDYDSKTFSYDKIFPISSKQEEVFESSSRTVVESVLKGYNGTIFAYGQTGTGKTYTMVGDFESQANKGIIPRSIDLIYSHIPKDKEHKYTITVSFIQIYLEAIQDLLEPKNKEIRIREDPEKGVYLEGVQWIKVNSTADCANVFHFGEKNRVTESTSMNLHSSRSHAIFIVKIEKSIMLSQEKIAELSKESNEQIKSERVMTNSMLFLVDLAGSERVKKTRAENIRLEEAKKINYSLLVLGNCIQSLTDNKSNHVSYRDSKLTRLLQESLGGNAKTCLIVTVSPSGYNTEETFSSLNFALRAMKVQNKPIINKSVDYQALCIKLQEDLDKLNDQYAILKIDYDKVTDENTKMKSGEMYVEMQRKSIVNAIHGNDNGNENDENKNVFALAKDAKKKNSKNKDGGDDKGDYNEEIKKLEQFYEGVLQAKTEEYENILKEIDCILADKETQIEALTNDLNTFKQKIKSQTDSITDLQKEKDDLMESVNDLTIKLTYERESSKANTLKESKEIQDKLTSTIESLESKVIKLEKQNDSLQKVSKGTLDKYTCQLDAEIKKLIDTKNDYNQQKNNYIIKSSQNEIKIKIDNDELNNSKKKLEKVTEDMKKILRERIAEIEKEIKTKQDENKGINDEKGRLCLIIGDYENEIEMKKELYENITALEEDETCTKKDKTVCICEGMINEVNMQLAKMKSEKDRKCYEGEMKEKKTLSTELSTLKEHNMTLISDIKQLNQTINQLMKENDSMSKGKESHEKEKANFLMENNHMKESVNSLTKQLDNAVKSSKDLQSEVDSCHSQINRYEKENKEYISQLEEMKEKIKVSNDAMEKESKEKIVNEKIMEELRKKVIGLEQQVTAQERELIKREETIKSTIDVNANFNQEMTTKINEVNTQRNTIEKITIENSALKENVDRLTKEITEAKAKILSAGNQLLKDVEIKDKYKKENDDLKKIKEALESKIMTQERELDNHKEMFNKDILEKSNDLSITNALFNTSKKETIQLKETINLLNKQIVNEKTTSKDLQSQLNLLQNNYTKCNEELLKETANKTQYEKSYIESLKNIKALETQIALQEKEVVKHKETITSASNASTTVSNENQQLKQTINELNKQINDSREEIKTLSLETIKYIEKNNNTEQEMTQLKYKAEQLQEQVTSQSEELTKRDEIILSSITANENFNQEMKNKIEDFNTQKANYLKEITILNKNNTKLTKDLAAINEELTAKEEIITNMTKESDENKAKLTNVELALAQTQSTCLEKDKKNKENEETIVNLSLSNTSLKNDCKTMEKKMNEHKDEIALHIKDIGLYKAKDQQASINLKKSKESIDKLTKDIEIKELQLKEMTNSFNTIKKELDNKSTDISSKSSEVCNLTIKLHSLESSITALTLKNNEEHSKYRELQSKQSDTNDKLQSLQSLHNTSLQSIEQKDSEILKVNSSITSLQLQLNESLKEKEQLTLKLKDIEDSLDKETSKNHKQSKSYSREVTDLTEKNKQLQSTIVFSCNTINDLKEQITDSLDQFIKYEHELNKIKQQISSSQPIDICALTQLIENDTLSDEDSDPSQKRSLSLLPQVSIDQTIIFLGEKCQLTKDKINSMIHFCYNLLQETNKSQENQTSLKSTQVEKLQKFLTNLSSQDISSVPLIQKRIYSLNNSTSMNDLFSTTNEIYTDLIAKYQGSITEKDEEINHLNDRIEYFIKELDIVRKSNEEINKGVSSSAKIQNVKYESQLKLKNEEIGKMNKRLEEHLKNINSLKKEISGLMKTIENNQLSIKKLEENLDAQSKDIQEEKQSNMKTKMKVADKDLNTGKFVIREYMNKTYKFALDLYAYCDSSNNN